MAKGGKEGEDVLVGGGQRGGLAWIGMDWHGRWWKAWIGMEGGGRPGLAWKVVEGHGGGWPWKLMEVDGR